MTRKLKCAAWFEPHFTLDYVLVCVVGASVHTELHGGNLSAHATTQSSELPCRCGGIQPRWCMIQLGSCWGEQVPEPIDQNRHCVVMSLVDAYPLTQIRELRNPGEFLPLACCLQIASNIHWFL